MMALSIGLVLFAAALLQTLIPAAAWLGMAKVPLLLGAVVYYALLHRRGPMLIAAFAAGLLSDALGFVPLGYSSFCFCLFGLTIQQLKGYLFRESVVTASVLTGAGVMLYSGAMAVALLFVVEEPLIRVGAGRLALRTCGAALLAFAGTPPLFAVAFALDRLIGNVRASEA